MISRLSKMFKFINLRKERNQTRIENAEGGKAGDKKKSKQSVPIVISTFVYGIKSLS